MFPKSIQEGQWHVAEPAAPWPLVVFVDIEITGSVEKKFSATAAQINEGHNVIAAARSWP